MRGKTIRHVKKELILILAAALLSGLLALPLWAQATTNEVQKEPGQNAGNEWEFTIVPYAWLSSISGDIRAKGRTIHASVPFNEIFNNLDFAGQVQVEPGKVTGGCSFAWRPISPEIFSST
jgi:hypothetical protein